MTRHHRFGVGWTLRVAALAAVAALCAVTAGVANAASFSGSFVYHGSNNDTQLLLDSGLMYADGCVLGDDPITCFPDDFPGTIWFRVQAGVHSTVVTAQSADFNLDGPDAYRQDSSSTLTSTLNAVDADGKEVVVKTTPFIEIDIAYDAPLANCSKNTITTIAQLDAADTSGCLNNVVHQTYDIGEFQALAKDTTLPYSGTRNLSETNSSPSLDILPGVLSAHLELVTAMALHATTGYTANRVLAASGDPGTPIASGGMNWPDANPVQDTLTLPCTAPAGDSLVYKLTNNAWTGQGAVTTTPKVVISLLGFIDIPIAGPSATLFDDGVLATATDFTRTLGPIAAENKAPTVNLGPITPGSEGSTIQFTAVGTGPGGSFDNCDVAGNSLSFHWTFDDGGSAFGKTVHHKFTDNNGGSPHSAHLIVTDSAGNTVDRDFSVAVANVDPTLNAGLDRTTLWGVPVWFHGNGADAGALDALGLGYSWQFGDGSGALGQDVSHAYATPGSYTVQGTVTDKDGGSGGDSATVTVTKRATTAVYTGPNKSTPSKTLALTGTLTDELGQPVAGRTVTFMVGTQSVASTTNGSGVATASLRLTQKTGTYQASILFNGDAKYVTSSNSMTFIIGK